MSVERSKGGKTCAHLDTLWEGRDQTSQESIQTGSVHVSTPQNTVCTGNDSRLVMFCRVGNKCLFDSLVGVGVFLGEGLDLGRDVCE